MSEELLGSFQSFSKCTASAEQKALKRLSQPENTARASRTDIEFALGIVNQTNQLFSKKTGEIRKQCEASAAAFVESVERMIRVAVAAFRFLHANRSTAGFNPLALEKTICNFTTACANAHLGLRAWEGLSFLRACLLAHAEAHILAPASTKGATSSSRSALPTAGRALRKPAAKAKGAASTRAAPQKSDTAGSSEESLTTNMHRLSIGTGKANGSSSSRRTKDGAVGSIHFPVQYCNGDLAFNNLVVTLLCNFLRALSQDSASKQTAELAEDLARKNNSALDWCLRVHGIDSDSVEPFLGVCFRSYYALGTISEQHSLEIRLLGLVAYSKTKACDYRELLRYATRAALRAESSAAETQDLDGRLDAYFSGVLDLIKAQLGSLSVSPELVEFCHQAANVKQRAAGLEKALDACRLPLLSSQGDKDAHAKLVSESLSTYALVNSALRRGSLRSEAHSIALSLPLLADEALSPKARHTLAGWNSLAVCADMLRKIAKRAFGELRQPKLEPLQSDLAGVLIRVMDVAGRIYEAYISRGAAAKAESVGGTSAASLLNCNAEVYLLTIQFALQFQESSVAAQETMKSHSDRLLALCKKGKCSADFLRNHSTVFFNRGASLYQLKIYGQAAQTMDHAIGSLEQWIATSQASHASLGDALNQLCKRYEIAGSAYQSNRSFDDAAKLFGRAISWISAQFQDQVCTSIVSSQGHKVVLPPYSSVPENSAEVKRISQFVDRYVRMCAGRLVKDPRETDLHASVVKYAADLPKDSVACAWLYEVEAYHWRPFSNAPSGSTSAIRTGHLTSALAIYETTSPLGYARCLIELAKLDRDGGSREACLDRLHAAMEITKELSEDSIYVLSALSECYAWRGIVGIEAGDMATDDIAACVNLWSLLHKRASAPIADSDGRSVPDCGLLRDAANTMNRTLELLMSRRMHALCSDILAVLFSISSTCERYDRSWAPTTMESLIGLGTTSLLQGHMSTAAEHFQVAASRYETGVLPVHVEVASKIAYASFQIACGDSEGGAETMMAANGIARGALELGSASRSVRTKRAAATPDTLVLLSKASHAYSVLAMKQGALADSIDFGLHSYRILCSLLKSLSIAHKKSTLEQTSSHSTPSEDDPFSDAKPDETEGVASAGDGEDDKSDAQFLAFSGNWELQRLLISNMAHLAEIYSTRGSVKEAQYFLKKGLEISAQMHAPYSESLVRLQEVDVLSRKNLWDECASALQKVRAATDDQAGRAPANMVGAMEVAGALVLEGDSWRRCRSYEQAQEAYTRAASLIEGMSDGEVANEISLVAADPTKMTPRLERIIGQITPIRAAQSVGKVSSHDVSSDELAGPLSIIRSDLTTRQQLVSSLSGLAGDAKRHVQDSDAQVARSIDKQPEHLLMQANLLFVELQRMLEEEEAWGLVLKSALMFPALQRSRTQKPRRGTIKALIKTKLGELDELLTRAAAAAIIIGSAHCVHESCSLLALVKSMHTTFGLGAVDASETSSVIARVLDDAKNITAVREVVDVLRHKHEDVPAQLTMWPTDILDMKAGAGAAHKSSSDVDSSPLSCRLNASQSPSARGGSQAAGERGSSELLLSSLNRLSLAGRESENRSIDGFAGDQERVFMNTVDGSRIVSEWTVSEGIQSRTLADALPSSWVACGVSIDRSRNIMFVTRYQNGHGPVAVCLPMRTVEAGADTFDIGVGDAESQGAFDGAYQKLKTIIAESDKTMKTGSSCSTDDEKRKWWLHRTSLDRQLGDLLESIEDEWLGGFKGILQPEDSLSGDIDIDLLRSRIQSCVGKSLSKAFATKAKSLDLSDNICLFVLNAAGRIWRRHSGHSSKEACESSDWLDVCSMLLDTYCYQGAAPTFEEDGISEFADRLKDTALEFIDSTGIGKREDKASGKRHLILVLDKHAQQIPWECLPCLRDYPISRMPSVAFLQHRLAMAREGVWSAASMNPASGSSGGLLFESLSKPTAPLFGNQPLLSGGSDGLVFSPMPSSISALAALDKRGNESSMPLFASPACTGVSGTALPADHPPGVAADSSRVFYILNPEGDLHRTQSNFEDYLRGQASWHGVIDRKPMSHECEHGISSSDVFLYFGHGGAESYISRSQIRKLRRCAVSLLVGCSSGHLKPAGEYDAMGTAMDYMIGGCPTLVANLWDVGDKDIDRFTAEMLHSWGLDQHTSGKVALMADQEDAPPGQQVSLAEAVCKARKACRMAFLTGAAPVVYGIPAYLC